MHFFGRMCREGILLDKLTLISIITSTTNHGALEEGKLVHSYVAERTVHSDVFVGTALINMHGKCGSISDAQFVFDTMWNRDTIAWNTMIAVCAQNEEQRFCTSGIFNQMLQEGTVKDSATFVNLLSSCSSKEDLPQGKQLHVVANEAGLDRELVVATAILTMYGKCSDPKSTRMMFDRIQKHDAVSWNIMIRAYAVGGQRSEALQLFEEMQKEGGVKPDKISFLSILEAFSGEEALTKGKFMHECITHSGYELDVIVGTALINMYGRCGSPENAWMMFEKMQEKNAFTWNSMIAAFAQNAQGLRAIQLFKKMQEKGVKPDRYTLLSIVSSCATEDEIEAIISCIANTGVNLDDVSGSALIYLYSRCGSLAMVQDVFNRFSHPSLVLMNAMIAALARNGENRRALQLYKQLQLQGFLPDKDSYAFALDACEDEDTLSGGKQLHACIKVANLETNIVVGTALVNMYIRCCSLKEALTLFEDLSVQDVISWTSLITACCQLGRFSEAFRLFERMHKEGFQPDRVTFVCILSACTSPVNLTQGKCIHTLIVQDGQDTNIIVANALLNMYTRCGCVEDTLAVFKRVQFGDSVTYSSVLSACANSALLPEGREIHACITGTAIEHDNVVGNALVSFYGKCGSLEEAQLTFDKMPHRDTVTWTVLVAAYAQQGKGRTVLRLFNKMLEEEVEANEITFVNILSACCHDGLVYEACHHFNSMKYVYGVVPLVHHYDCLVDLFARAGRLEEAETVINGMPFPATTVSWTTLLSACKAIADVKRGKWAAEQALHLDPKNYTPYLILRNIYGAAGNIDDSLTVMEQVED
ncbi:hypothetical protein L7F22_048369 [Adiantum nelumboides]|nr:hypothetical protein [Adiantum nelumboides]